MNHKPNAEYAGLGAMSAVKELVELLVSNGSISKADGVRVFTNSAEDHEKAALTATTNANADAAKILRMCEEDIRRMPEE